MSSSTLLLTDPNQKQCDTIKLAQTSTTDVYTFLNGGTSGNLVMTITITYTDSTKTTVQSVVRVP